MIDLHLADLKSSEFRENSDNAPMPLFLYCVSSARSKKLAAA
jgi:hypothetical protein